MSERYSCGDWADPVIEEDETDFDEPTQDEIFRWTVERHLEDEENLLQEIKVADSQRID